MVGIVCHFGRYGLPIFSLSMRIVLKPILGESIIASNNYDGYDIEVCPKPRLARLGVLTNRL
jgi:hypothetical protein